MLPLLDHPNPQSQNANSVAFHVRGGGTYPRDELGSMTVSASVLPLDLFAPGPILGALNRAVQPGLQFGVDVFELCGDAKLVMRPDLGRKSFAPLDQLRSLRGQGFEVTQPFCKTAASGIGSKGKEAGNEFAAIRSVFARVPRLCANVFT